MKIEDHDRENNNFDFIRLLAASMVVFSHSFDLIKLNQLEPLRRISHDQLSFGSLGVYIFFVMSGYLITQSLFRSRDYKSYFAKRSLRIFPALILDILIAVFIFGPLFTSYSMTDYFSDKLTYSYLANFSLYRISYYLPGVFESHPYREVNGSLWTLCYEFTCYVGIIFFHFFRILQKRIVFLFFYVFSLILWILIPEFISRYNIPYTSVYLSQLFPLSLFFGSGMLFFLYKEKIKFHWLIASGVGLMLALGILSGYGLLSCQIGLSYFVLFFVFKPNRILGQAGKLGDFSYGIYVYSFSIQQIIIHFTSINIPIGWMILFSFLFTIPFAVFSWFAVERKALLLKDYLFKSAQLPKTV